MNPTRILIVDDHQLAREGLKAVLDGKDIQIVALAATGEDAVELANRHRPDLVLMDIRLGDGIDGLEATRQIVSMDIGVKVLMLTLTTCRLMSGRLLMQARRGSF